MSENKTEKYLMASVRARLSGLTGKLLTTALILTVCLIITYLFLNTHNKALQIFETKSRQMTTELKMQYMKDTINNLILQIEVNLESARQHYKRNIAVKRQIIEKKLAEAEADYSDIFLAEFSLGSETGGSWTVFIWEGQDNLILAPADCQGLDLSDALAQTIPSLLDYSLIEKDNVSCLFGYSQAYIESTVKQTMADSIRAMTFASDSYIWVNEVLDYAGGDNYAIRRVHPNLPDTEGSFLSTAMTDITGETPYLTELEGIREKGEIFFSYHFKELNSDFISEKLSYAKLFADFDWIIAIGVHNNELDSYISQTSSQIRSITIRSFGRSLLVLLSSVLATLLVLILLERQRHQHSKLQMEIEVSFDPLTGVKSRRFGNSYLEKSFAAYQKNTTSPALIIMVFDVDNFKSINDRYGHHEGDLVLQKIASTVQAGIRSGDELFRMGGDEFVGVFSQVEADSVGQLAQKILESINTSEHKAGQDKLKLSISAGFSNFRPDDFDFSNALKRADQAMYRAKAKGGNDYRLDL